jgi:hypothetical protein
MKKLLALLCLLAGFSQPAAAGDFSALSALSQADFKTLSEDFGSAMSYKAVTPPTPLAGLLGFGFDIGIEATSTDISKSGAILKTATAGSVDITSMIIPKLHVAVGLPFGIDVAAFTSVVPSTSIKLTGAELRVALLKGGVAYPSVGIRGAMTKMSGVDELAFDTKSLDISISKGFLMLTPYAGVGQVWVNSKANVAGTDGALDTSFTQSKAFVGANLNLGLTNFALEGDKTGGATSYSFKMGFRW